MPGTTWFFAIKTADAAGNISGLSNSPQGVTTAVPVEKYSLRKYAPPEPHIVTVNAWSESLVSLVNIFGTTNPASGVKVDFSISTWPVGAQGQELSKSTEASVNGLADVLLKLGNIPAEYGVTAACNTCEASASTVTFTCCGKLATDEFRQADPRWGTQILGNNPPANTIGAVGCALTSVANMLNFHNPDNQTDPRLLNQDMIVSHVYNSNDDILWERVGNVPTATGLHYTGAWDFPFFTRDNLREAIDADLLLRRPVVLRTQRPGRQFPHFILAVGRCGANYIVVDPGTAAVMALYDPNDTNLLLMGVRRYAPQ
ncbi:MAG TPA: hypothetical protein DDW67_04160 [Elusimicrobia bacterium]|nr:hypothetical protein [Elusimicrobiota bacterium]